MFSECLANLSKQQYTGQTLDKTMSRVCPDYVHSKPLIANTKQNDHTLSKVCPCPMFVQTLSILHLCLSGYKLNEQPYFVQNNKTLDKMKIPNVFLILYGTTVISN